MYLSILDELGSKTILTDKNIIDLRNYISNKYAADTMQERALILADAIRRMVSDRIPQISACHKERILTGVLRELVAQESPCISAVDILKHCLALKIYGNVFFSELANWLSSTLDKNISKEKVGYFAAQVYQLAGNKNELCMEEAIRKAEQSVGLLHPVTVTENIHTNTEDTIIENSIEGSSKEKLIPTSIQEEDRRLDSSAGCSDLHVVQNTQDEIEKEHVSSFITTQPFVENIEMEDPDSTLTLLESLCKAREIDCSDIVIPDQHSYLEPVFCSFEKCLQHLRNLSQKLKYLRLPGLVMVSKRSAVTIQPGRVLKFRKEFIIGVTSLVVLCTVTFTMSINGVWGSKGTVMEDKDKAVDFSAETVLAAEHSTAAFLEAALPASEVVMPAVKEAGNKVAAKPVKTDVQIKEQKADTKSARGQDVHPIAGKKKLVMKATAYDLSLESCGKPRNHPKYGVTSSGTRAKVQRTVAVDPSVIPLGSKLYIVFPRPYNKMNGVYVAEDTGRLIKGHTIDVFMGEDKPGEHAVHDKAREFGVRKVEVYLLNQ